MQQSLKKKSNKQSIKTKENKQTCLVFALFSTSKFLAERFGYLILEYNIFNFHESLKPRDN